MYRIASAAVLTVLAVAASGGPILAAEAAPPDTTVPAEGGAPTDTAATAEFEPAGTEAVVVVDESGSPIAAITVAATEPAWTGYGENDAPESGHEYLRITVVVESRTPRGLVEVDDNDFIVQDADGFVTSADVVQTAEQDAADEDPVSEAELAEGETVELALTFEMVSGVPPLALFYQPSSDRLVTVTDLG